MSVTLTLPDDMAAVIAATLGEQPSARCGAAWCEVTRQMAEQGKAVELLSLEPTGRGDLARIVKRQNERLATIEAALSEVP